MSASCGGEEEEVTRVSVARARLGSRANPSERRRNVFGKKRRFNVFPSSFDFGSPAFYCTYVEQDLKFTGSVVDII